MKDHNINNSSCGFSGDLIGYLYDEIGGGERRVVEQHLAKCDLCSTEFAAVSSARNSVGEWFSQEFVGSPTPKFEFAPQRQDEKSIVWSVWTMLSRIRFRVPVLAAASALVIFGAVLFIRSTASDTEVASVSVPAVSTPSDEGIAANLGESSPVPVQTADSTNSIDIAADSVEPSRSVDVNTRALSSRKMARQEPKTRETRPGERNQRTFPSDRSVAEGMQTKPSLNGYEEKEDETLRLEDIFSEIDAS
ncbi:MAG: hypothetical protein ABI791_12160 [Acidobacteriota bacterium]